MDRRRFKEPTEYSRLPKEYQEVKYITKAKTPIYMLSGFVFNRKDIIIKARTSITSSGAIFGSQNSFVLYARSSTTGFFRTNGTDTRDNLVFNSGSNEIEYNMPQNKFTINGIEYLNMASPTIDNVNIPLFGRYRDGAYEAGFYGGSFEEFTIETTNGEKLVHLIPAYDISLEISGNFRSRGMYDIVNNIFIREAVPYTTDYPFTKGANVSSHGDCDAPGELGPDNPLKAKFIGYKKVDDTVNENIKIVDRLWDYKRGFYKVSTGEFYTTSYVGLGVIGNDGLSLGIIPEIGHSYEITAKRTVGGWFFGSYVFSPRYPFDFGLSNNAFRFGGRYKTGLPNFADGEYHTFFHSEDKSIVDGIDYGKEGSHSFTPIYNSKTWDISLYKPSGGSTASPENCVIKEFKEYDENMIVIHDFVAVDEPNFVGFRDTITGEEKTMAGLYAVYE